MIDKGEALNTLRVIELWPLVNVRGKENCSVSVRARIRKQ